MVSLINFKLVNEELQQHQHQQQMYLQHQHPNEHQHQNQQPASESSQPAVQQTLIRVVHADQQPQAEPLRAPQLHQTERRSARDSSESVTSSDSSQVNCQSVGQHDTQVHQQAGRPKVVRANNQFHKSPQEMHASVGAYGQRGQIQAKREQEARQSPLQANQANFVVTWRNLRFAIEPKWHQRLMGAGGPLASLRASTLGSSSSSSSSNSGSVSADQSASKLVLDRLDGSFRSGELTAILGPSGAGKTTLLDCLTGHRKSGLSGSIRISCSAGSLERSQCSCSPAPAPAPVGAPLGPKSAEFKLQLGAHFGANALDGQQQVQHASACQTNGDNLKVSIIPQNDHLIGHLSVYETLSYASKMKNCFDKHFNHKLNIRRVAQQLGLMSCLLTRINKLSGGQYKRVSIAQELLSSPDILILDEPTSGLDAMTCYQTVQVLRELTDERASSGQKQIAVILTIHQPNSDVFQQFNHVYVVAQGGRCIYEGAPASIESVISRVGLSLPSQYYNPATMIVEIAAGKFGAEAIQKLNGIQKKQYELALPDEQHSVGDSAVDCPSSSSTSDNDDQDDQNAAHGAPANDDNNNNGPLAGGLVNRGFHMDEPNNNERSTEDAHAGADGQLVVVVKAAPDAEDVDSLDQVKLANKLSGGQREGRRKRRRRVRRRNSDQPNELSRNPSDLSSQFDCARCTSRPTGASGGAGGSGGDAREKRLKLNSLKADQKFPFWRHTYLHFHRSWLSIVRDPMLCSMQLALHIIVPVMVSLVYGTGVGKPNACPRAGPVDIMAYALEPTDTALQLQEDLRTTLENIGYIFFKLYGIIFAAMTVTVLTFPLDMHVLVKEFRNGWYGLSSYFLGRTLADIPFQLTLPLLAMSLSYYATGQPYSYLQWRFLSITAILILSSLIAQSQGLLFGAILMDKMKAAVFVAPAATTPIILFAGFLVRTQSIPRYLRPLSNLSYLRYAIEGCLISRYGFNQCECDPSVFNQTVPELPPIARSMLDYWLSSFKISSTSPASLLLDAPETGANSSALQEAATTTLAPESNAPDLFTKLIDSLAKANSFGRNITSCEQVLPYPMIDYDLKDEQLASCFLILIFMLLFTRLLTFFIVCFKVKRKV